MDMAKLIVEGLHKLNGAVGIHGAKNSALPVLAATLLANSVSEIGNCPRLSDVDASVAILRCLGCQVDVRDHVVTVDPAGMCRCEIPDHLMREMRSSIVFLGAIIAKCGEARMSFPGGCELGPRPIDLHLDALEKLGVAIEEERGHLRCRAKGRLKGTEISLALPSVGATENVLLAAATADGTTVLHNAAREPEIEDLAAFLNRCGGRVQGAGTGTVRVQGARRLHGCSFAPLPDRITAATFACACAAAGGRVELAGCAPRLYAPVLEILEQMGCGVVRRSDAAVITRFGRLYGPGRVFTGAYPALATDAAPLLAAVLLCAEGPGSIEDVIFERRFGCAAGFAALGGRVRVEGRTLYAEPGGTLQGTVLEAPDLRGGAALVIAALAAQGSSRITHTEFIDRGYADFAQKLTALGGQIARETPRGADCPKKRTSKT